MLRKEERDLKLGLPGRRAVWAVNIVERFDPNVYGLAADREETPNSTADGHGPHIVAVHFPLRCRYRS
jgi:hypothetical protein